MANSTTPALSSKPDNRPAKPYADYPLFFHQTGRIAKKIRGKLHYFGRWGNVKGGKVVPVDDVGTAAQAAVDLYNEQRDDLQAGRTPRIKHDGLALGDLCNAFLTAKRRLVDSGELKPRTFGEYHATCKTVVDAFGRDRPVDDIQPDDLGGLRAKLAKRFGPVTLGNQIQRIRSLFKWAFDEGKIDRPIRYGQQFDKPSKRVVRKAKADAGPRMFEAEELRRILDDLDSHLQLRTMTLLAINCGFGASDLASLPQSAIDLDGGWARFPRPKTGIDRQAKLWPETVEAVRAVLAVRREPLDAADGNLVFINSRGKRWVREPTSEDSAKWTQRTDLIGNEFAKSLKRLGITGRRGFYAIRHSFETAAGECKDQIAVNVVMGHADHSMAGVYRERISDERLETVAATVAAWLKGGEPC